MQVESVNVHLVLVTSCFSLHSLVAGLQVAWDTLVLEMRCLVRQLVVVVVGKARQGNFIYIALFIHKADSKCFTYKHCYTIK